MILKNYYYYFKKAIPEHICDKIVEYGSSKDEEKGLTGFKQSLGESKKRDSFVSWISEKWLYDIIHPYVHEANKAAGWNFEWDFTEDCQFTKYKLNQHYDWHCDSSDDIYDNQQYKNIYGKTRKLSTVIALSDPKDYKGGEFKFDFRNIDTGFNIVEPIEIKEKGSVMIFPSFVWHKVCPVTEGTRYSLVCWHLGYPFK